MRLAAAASMAGWTYLALAHGRFWRTTVTLPPAAEPAWWPEVVAVVPARDGAAMLPLTLPSLLGRDYPGRFRGVVVDDSTDGTGDVARALGGEVVQHGGPLPGWVGKVAALAAGVEVAGRPHYLLFTDADVVHSPESLPQLVAAAGDRVLVSQMVRLAVDGFWERESSRRSSTSSRSCTRSAG